jgi:hypothetical protein
MAPKKTKKPSMMQRQRQLSAQQQQVKQASSNKLPPGKKGGAVTKPKPTKPTATSKPSPVQQVRVRDLGPTKPKPLSGASQRALPPGRPGGSLARSGGGSLATKAGGLSAGGVASRALGALGIAGGTAAEIQKMRDRAARDAERNKKLNRRPFEELRADSRTSPSGSSTRSGQGNRKPTAAKPAAKPANVADYKDAQGNVYDGNTGRLKTAAKPKSKPKPKPAAPAAAKPKPEAPSKPVAKPSETYKDGGKGLYQGSKEYRDKVGGSGNPLLNRFRRDMGRDAKTGERQYSTPEDKSKYVDKNGKLKIQDKPKPQPTAAKSNPKPPTSKTGGNTPITASKPMEGGTPFNTRNRFETPEQRKKRLAREGRA